MIPIFPHFSPLLPPPSFHPQDFIASLQGIYFVKVSTRRGVRSGSQVIGFILYQVIQFSFQLTQKKTKPKP